MSSKLRKDRNRGDARASPAPDLPFPTSPPPVEGDGAVDAQVPSLDERPFYREQLKEAQLSNGLDSEGKSGGSDQPAASGKVRRPRARKPRTGLP